MRSSAVQIGCVAFGVLGLILVTVCCAVPSWMVFSITIPSIGPSTGQIGLWKMCEVGLGQQGCTKYESLPSLDSQLQTTRAMTVISCLLAYLGFLLLLLLGFCANFIPFLQNADAKSKVRLGVGVGLLLAGLLVIIPVCWFPHIIEQNMKTIMPGGGFIEVISKGSFGFSKGAGIYVGWVAGVLLLLGGSLLILFRKKDIP